MQNYNINFFKEESFAYPQLVTEILGLRWSCITYLSFFYYCGLVIITATFLRKIKIYKERDTGFLILQNAKVIENIPNESSFAAYIFTLVLALIQALIVIVLDYNNLHRYFFLI